MRSRAASLAPVSVTMPPGTGVSWALGGCTNLAGIDWPTFIPLMKQNFAAPILDPSRFTLFITRNAVTVQNGLSLANCCAYGWHDVQYDASNRPMTYAIADYDSTGALPLPMPDIMTISHEVAEWLNDPLTTNWAPRWELNHFLFEVADPLLAIPYSSSGITMPNGLTYHPQQLAYFSWFYGDIPSLGAGGGYSASGDGTPVFTQPAPSE